MLSIQKKRGLKDVLKTQFPPIVKLKHWYEYKWLPMHYPKKLAGIRYKRAMGRELNWEHPRDLNEKINWMKFNTDISEWTRLSDKYRVREYLKERGREDLLVELYGVWENADDIDFDTLPQKFVLKSNHGCGTVILVENKSKQDYTHLRKQLNQWLESIYGFETAEPQYIKIKPLLIAEELLENDNPSSTSLVDYKVFCVNGEVFCIMVCANRVIGKGMQAAIYDVDWNLRPDMLSGVHTKDRIDIPKPRCLNELLKAATDLSKGHPFVRADFYIVNNKVYFGEMTFTPKGGYSNTIAYPFMLEMGEKISLVKK